MYNSDNICKRCGYQLFPMDTVCDRCGERIVRGAEADTNTVNKKARKSLNKEAKSVKPKKQKKQISIDTEQEMPSEGKRYEVLICILIPLVLAGAFLIRDFSKYKSAEKYAKQGNYTEAKEAYEDIIIREIINDDLIKKIYFCDLSIQLSSPDYSVRSFDEAEDFNKKYNMLKEMSLDTGFPVPSGVIEKSNSINENIGSY